jgi:hypothetical protein
LSLIVGFQDGGVASNKDATLSPTQRKEEADGLVGETRQQSQLSHKADEYISNEISFQRSLKSLLCSIRERAG